MFRFTIREMMLAVAIVAILLAWSIDKWYSLVQKSEEMRDSQVKIQVQGRLIESQQKRIRDLRSNGVPPPTPAMEAENEALRLEVKLLKKQLLGYE